MSKILYRTTSGEDYGFDIRLENGRYQVYVVSGPPYPSTLVPLSECPPGCERIGKSYRISWFSLAVIQNLSQAKSMAAGWAEDTIRFIQTGKWVIPYYTNSGRSTFVFSIEKGDSQLRIYILSQPSYQNRSAGSIETHRLGNNPKYICWDGPIQTWDKAEQIASLWSEKTETYIRTGKRF